MKQLMVLLLACCCFYSCSTFEYMSVDTLTPSDISFSPDVKAVAIVNNTLPHEANSDRKLSLQATLPVDARAVSEKLAEEIANANYFETVVICDSMIRSKDVERPKILPPYAVSDLAKDLGVDMLLVVDEATVKTGSTMMYVDWSEDRVPVLSGAMLLETHIYLPGREKPFQHFIDKDTIYWDMEGLSNRQVAEDAVKYITKQTLNHVVPQWRPEDRFYFRGGNINMRDAAVALQEGDWDLAYENWKKEYDSQKGKRRMRAAFNIAFYYEIKGDIKLATQYIQEAKRIADEKSEKTPDGKIAYMSEECRLVNFYKDELEKKDMTLQKLDLQMKRFDK